MVASSSGEEQVVVNGMSYYARNGENSNAAVVVQVVERIIRQGRLVGLISAKGLRRRHSLPAGRITVPLHVR